MEHMDCFTSVHKNEQEMCCPEFASRYGPSDGAEQPPNDEHRNRQISGRNRKAEGGAAETGQCMNTWGTETITDDGSALQFTT